MASRPRKELKKRRRNKGRKRELDKRGIQLQKGKGEEKKEIEEMGREVRELEKRGIQLTKRERGGKDRNGRNEKRSKKE